MEVVPELWYGKLARMLGVEVLKHGVESSTGDSQKIACQGVVMGYDGAPLMPLFEVDNSVRDGESFVEAPLVSGAQGGWYGC